jgi:hypothetical protein
MLPLLIQYLFARNASALRYSDLLKIPPSNIDLMGAMDR